MDSVQVSVPAIPWCHHTTLLFCLVHLGVKLVKADVLEDVLQNIPLNLHSSLDVLTVRQNQDMASCLIPAFPPPVHLAFSHQQMQSWSILSDDVSLGWCIQYLILIHSPCLESCKAQALGGIPAPAACCSIIFSLSFSQATIKRTVEVSFSPISAKGDVINFSR